MVDANLGTVSLVDAVCESLRLAVIAGELAPGTGLTELKVSERYGVARTTAKAALERLVATGFLQRTMHRSARVPVITADDIVDLHESRIVIESDAVRRLAAAKTLPAEAEEAAEAVLRHANAGNADKMAASDVAFHRALVEAAGVHRLARMHTMVMGEAHLCMVQVHLHDPEDAELSFNEHRGVMESIKAGRVEEASERIRSHLVRTRDALLEAIG